MSTPEEARKKLPGMTDLFSLGLSEAEFAKLSSLIYSTCGIKMPTHKKSMLESRLRRRLRSLGLTSFGGYCDFLFASDGMEQELTSLIDVVTTNKTDFYREAAHFDFLIDRALPDLINRFGTGFDRPLRLWSAGCSTGEEPYSLAMVLSEFGRHNPGFSFSILATDISTEVLSKAARAVYAAEKVEPVPEECKRRYLLRNREGEKKLVRIVPELRSLVSFRHLNFMDEDYGIREHFDLIFCRNVIIYFDRPTQQTFLRRLCHHLDDERYLFMGHSETLHGMQLPLGQKAPAVYRKLAT